MHLFLLLEFETTPVEVVRLVNLDLFLLKLLLWPEDRRFSRFVIEAFVLFEAMHWAAFLLLFLLSFFFHLPFLIDILASFPFLLDSSFLLLGK
jgi:hypothetical protein